MPNDNFIAENDALLMDFLSAKAEIDAENFLNRLFEENIIPQIRKVLASYLTLTFDEKDEIQSDAQTRILAKLWKLRANNSAQKAVKDFTAYVSTVTFNSRKDFILRQKPEWRRIDYRLRRLKDEKDCVWHFFSDAVGHEFVGLKKGEKQHSEIELDEIISIFCEKYPNHLFLKTQEIVPSILEFARGALTKNEVIKACLQITESANFEEIELPEEMSEFLNHSEDEYLLSQRQTGFLRRIWDEIKTFPPNQRKVLLLSLKESRNVEAVSLLLKKRIATIKEIAAALEVSLEEFSEIFAKLPMTSQEIAEFLDIKDSEKTSKEQKVDNLRRIARDLLRRRLGIKKL
ncbi:MAG TPA: hypothetical protein PKE69_09425 [Pyrinomonadaceae bacterium]|nr:hypothetical protein [Pyrinomonadaceae bacterium]